MFDVAVRGAQELDAARSALAEALDAYRGAEARDATNVTKVLTVYAAVMFPLSLVAGFYGMNFANLPGLNDDRGWVIITAVMLLIAVASLAAFIALGWYSAARRYVRRGPRSDAASRRPQRHRSRSEAPSTRCRRSRCAASLSAIHRGLRPTTRTKETVGEPPSLGLSRIEGASRGASDGDPTKPCSPGTHPFRHERPLPSHAMLGWIAAATFP